MSHFLLLYGLISLSHAEEIATTPPTAFTRGNGRASCSNALSRQAILFQTVLRQVTNLQRGYEDITGSQ